VACHIGLSSEAKDAVFALKSALFKRQLYTTAAETRLQMIIAHSLSANVS
jgi:hypothetical protein